GVVVIGEDIVESEIPDVGSRYQGTRPGWRGGDPAIRRRRNRRTIKRQAGSAWPDLRGRRAVGHRDGQRKAADDEITSLVIHCSLAEFPGNAPSRYLGPAATRRQCGQ